MFPPIKIREFILMVSFILRVPSAKKNPYPKEMISYIAPQIFRNVLTNAIIAMKRIIFWKLKTSKMVMCILKI